MSRTGDPLSAGTRLLAASLAALLSVTHAAAWEARSVGRDSYSVKSAFRDVVADANQSTVRVRSDGYAVALGTVVAADGLIVTKASELKGELECQFRDGRRIPARRIAVDEQYDLALLKVDVENLHAIRWADGAPPQVGSWLAAPGQETIPVAIGVVSVAPREVRRRLAAVGIKIGEGKQGPRVHSVVRGSGAADAGMRAGDVITHLDGEPCPNRKTFIDTIQTHRPGEVVNLKLLRGEESLELSVRLSDLQHLTDTRGSFLEEVSGRLSQRRAGFPLALQHDMVLDPRYCGGAVVDLDGRAVGINIARANRVATYAIPAGRVREAIERMKKTSTLVSAQPTD